MSNTPDTQDRRMASDAVVVGGTEHQGEITEAEKQRIIRRKLCQAVFATNPTRDMLMAAMVQHSISAQEMQDAMDYQVSAIDHMRAIGVPDGFAGLKVWSEASLQRYFDWKARQYNPIGGGTFADDWRMSHIEPMSHPTVRVRAMEVLDRAAKQSVLTGEKPLWEQ